jgi:translocation protein SEC63
MHLMKTGSAPSGSKKKKVVEESTDEESNTDEEANDTSDTNTDTDIDGE